jgi:hypothetical protein
MAENAEVTKLRRKSRSAAFEALRKQKGFPVPPRRAVSLANKKSKGLAYPLPPYPGGNLLLLFQWARGEWQSLGKYQKVALPIIALVVLTTWEKEYLRREARWDQVEHEETIALADKIYIKATTPPQKRKGIFKFLPFNRKG